MNRNGIAKISLNYSAQDYNNLYLSINSSKHDWEMAIEMLVDRFQERFFSTIYYLSHDMKTRGISINKIEQNGFAIMALNCLLIDTFYQFEYGLETSSEYNDITNDRGVSRHYKAFLQDKFPHLFMNDELAALFYNDIRCGILHSAQTKGCSMLACEDCQAVEYINPQIRMGIKVNVSLFSEALRNYFYNDYVRRLKNNHQQTREAFIRKMNFVCEM